MEPFPHRGRCRCFTYSSKFWWVKTHRHDDNCGLWFGALPPSSQPPFVSRDGPIFCPCAARCAQLSNAPRRSGTFASTSSGRCSRSGAVSSSVRSGVDPRPSGSAETHRKWSELRGSKREERGESVATHRPGRKRPWRALSILPFDESLPFEAIESTERRKTKDARLGRWVDQTWSPELFHRFLADLEHQTCSRPCGPRFMIYEMSKGRKQA